MIKPTQAQLHIASLSQQPIFDMALPAPAHSGSLSAWAFGQSIFLPITVKFQSICAQAGVTRRETILLSLYSLKLWRTSLSENSTHMSAGLHFYLPRMWLPGIFYKKSALLPKGRRIKCYIKTLRACVRPFSLLTQGLPAAETYALLPFTQGFYTTQLLYSHQ